MAMQTKAAAVEFSSEVARPQITKIDTVIALLRRDEGTTLAEMMDATGWQPHSTRAALTGLRKKGHIVEKSKRDEVTCYRITEAA